MADTERPMSMLPSIKCSTCGVDIPITQLADHICTTSSTKNSEPTSPPKLDRAATFGASRFNGSSTGQLRPGRMAPPPKIDALAANKPFGNLAPSPLSDYSNPKSQSPLSPRSPGPGRAPFKMNRSATSPMPRPMGPPSPDLPANMDCAFPPFPTSRSATPTGGKPKSRERPDQRHKHRYAEPSPLYAPLSPRTNGGESVLKRMNTIAPGPFDGRSDERRPSTSHGKSPVEQGNVQPGHRRTATQSSIKSNGITATQRASITSNRSRSSTFSNRSVGLPARPKPGVTAQSSTLPPPPPPPSNNETSVEGIDAFLDRLQKETQRPSQINPENRSKTFPLRKESNDAANPPMRPRRPSESRAAAGRTDGSNAAQSAPRPPNTFPIRSTSRAGSRSGLRPEALAPPLPPMPVLPKERPQKPLHTPSDSGLSDDSNSSSGFRSAASSRSSPPGSESSVSSRSASKSGRPDFNDEPFPRVASPESYGEPQRTDSRTGRTGYDRGKAPEPLVQGPTSPVASALESPMDPAIQMGLFQQARRSESRSSSRPLVQNVPRSPPKRMDSEEPRALPARRATVANKGNCKGCGEAITGKSVKDSSGRLSGRYHKQCFVCRTCRSPFPSADFYVFDNAPYCEQHYHKLNGSLCKACNRGIEGQYLDTDQRDKFHPKCFTCSTCRVVLRDDYYEVGGKVYCDRHAYHASQQSNFLGPGGNRGRNLQKRSTRLMMMA
ncbi:hypothetical protein EJ04DRAFT_575711 [Polyplosphaeria fusca]|uniref:LIM zinc-binding domain-containing protein n=1 Tax=Polyplosphaeria fusca TaxID=682080 RepID=A0A9P4V2Z0_9PLEO|nr:hypothetical protein EJ04DRAFT_575711 [Polyplosphaeria fusca]